MTGDRGWRMDGMHMSAGITKATKTDIYSDKAGKTDIYNDPAFNYA